MTTPLTRPSGGRIFLLALSIFTLAWTGTLKLFAMDSYSTLEEASMIQRLLLLTLPPLLLSSALYAGYCAWVRKDEAHEQISSAAVQAAVTGEELATTAPHDPGFTLEIRRFGVTVDRFRQRAMLMRLDEAGPRSPFLLQDPKKYPYNAEDRSVAAEQRENNVFGYALIDWVRCWPIPVIVAGPPRDAAERYADRMATHIGSADNGSGIHNPLYIQLDEIHTEHGDEVVEKLFEFFDIHPNLPAVVVLVEDGLDTRSSMRTPGENYLEHWRRSQFFVPKWPDSYVALLVTRKDRVDRTIRPYVVPAPDKLDNTQVQHDVIKLWNYFWAHEKAYPNPALNADKMPWDYWQSQLPEFWKTTPLNVPHGFKPNPWVPIPWTTWQMREFDEWPVLAYLHRPTRIDLSDGHGEPLKKGLRLEKLREGWQQSLGTLTPDDRPSRMFFDTGGSNKHLALLFQALHDNPQHIDLDDPKDAFDMQYRIGGDTGTSSTWVQMTLALMMGYGDGRTSALVNLRDPLHASIVMLSPPDQASRDAHPQMFSWDF